MLVAERRRRMNVSDKIGHDDYSYELHGEPPQIGAGHPSSRQQQYSSFSYPSGPIGDRNISAARLLDRGGGPPPPIVPSLAPPAALPPIPPSQHYPKPPVLLNTASSGMSYGSLGYMRHPAPPPLPHLMTNTQYTMPPSNVAISASLPGRAALPPIQRGQGGPQQGVLPPPPPMQLGVSDEGPQRVRSHANPSGLYGRGIGVSAGGGNSAGTAGALNWLGATPVLAGGGSAVGAAAAPPLQGGMGNDYRSRVANLPIPMGYMLDPSNLPPAGKSTHRYAMPSYFAPSGMPTPATRPRIRGKSDLFYT